MRSARPFSFEYTHLHRSAFASSDASAWRPAPFSCALRQCLNTASRSHSEKLGISRKGFAVKVLRTHTWWVLGQGVTVTSQSFLKRSESATPCVHVSCVVDSEAQNRLCVQLRPIPQILMNHRYFFLVGYFIMYEFCGYPLLCFCIQLVSGMLQCYKKCQVMIHLQTCISPLLSRPAERCDCHESSPRGQFRVVHSCIGRPPPFHFGPPWRGSLSGGRS